MATVTKISAEFSEELVHIIRKRADDYAKKYDVTAGLAMSAMCHGSHAGAFAMHAVMLNPQLAHAIGAAILDEILMASIK